MTQVTGKFDEELFRRYRSLPAVPKSWDKWTEKQRDSWAGENRATFAKTEQRRALEGRLVEDNGPLVKILVAQYRGEDNTPPRRGFTKARREPGVEHLSWEEAFACGQTGLVKALRGLNLKKGGFTKYTAWKIRHELQSAITKAQVISIPKGSDRADRPKGFDFFEDEDSMQRALLKKKEDEELAASDEPKLERPASAIADFIERRCRVVVGAPPMLWEWVAAKYEQHAHALQQIAVPIELGRQMRERGWTFGRMWHPIFGGTARSVCRLRVMAFGQDF